MKQYIWKGPKNTFSDMFLLNFHFQKIYFSHAELEEKNWLIIQYLMSEESHVQNTLGSKNNIP